MSGEEFYELGDESYREFEQYLHGFGVSTDIQTAFAGLSFFVELCYRASARAGWWTDISTGAPLNRNKGEMLALIHSEISECLEGERKGIPDDKLKHRPMAEVELADAVIRIFDYARGHGYDLPGALVEKLVFNSKRADHKVENRKKDGGKKY